MQGGRKGRKYKVYCICCFITNHPRIKWLITNIISYFLWFQIQVQFSRLSQATIKVSVKAVFITRLNQQRNSLLTPTWLLAGVRRSTSKITHTAVGGPPHPHSYSVETSVPCLRGLSIGQFKRTVGFPQSQARGKKNKREGNKMEARLFVI